MKTGKILILLMVTLALFAAGCSKEAEGNSTLKIRLTDNPLAVEEVNVDLEEIRVKLDRDSSKWITLQTNAGIYNLLALQNGVDTLVAQGNLPADVVKEIRLILGNDNTIKVDGQVHPLTIPSGSESGLKIKVNKKLGETIETIIIDFDAALSVKQEASGYKLRPVLKIK